ncbi:hypothetical protein LTR70_010477 [Exophiala xenobiotica]|uniref:Uncharacterized protein n=1 Tax=Lithohypha guttulata TaxID=1690604 RepID=A0ABR0JTU7_9EURO|nr:hypothetical protein LTR24_010720 [Lithohypha guttulata]KAK5309233.1 hypothetical protein LTR70_010477 [Exophiala xenobiotica]
MREPTLLSICLLLIGTLALPQKRDVVPQLVGSSVAMSSNATGGMPRSTDADENGSMIGTYNIKAVGQTILKTVYSAGSGQS